MERVPYSQFSGLENVYIEDSYVLDMSDCRCSLRDHVLTTVIAPPFLIRLGDVAGFEEWYIELTVVW